MEQYLPLGHKTFLKQVKISVLKSEEIIRKIIFYNFSSDFTRLNFEKKNLLKLSRLIGKLNSLLELDLYNNELIDLPASIGNLTFLEALELSNNKLTSLPKQFKKLSSLNFLNLSSNLLNLEGANKFD